MLSINYAKVPPFLSFPLSPFHSEYILPFLNRPLLLKISRTPRRFHVHATKRKEGNYSPLVAVSIPYLWPIVACARPVTSVLPLCIVISQSHRRMATIQPLAQIYLRANDFYSIRLGFYNLTYISVCMCEHAYRVSKLQKTGTVQWSLRRFAFYPWVVVRSKNISSRFWSPVLLDLSHLKWYSYLKTLFLSDL